MVGITVIRCGQVKEERSSMALQMTWHPNLRRRSSTAPPLGLKNLGNSCYLNSVLQCLTFTPPLANFCLNSLHSSLCDSESGRKGECPFCILEKRIVRSLSIDQTLDAPHKINNCLRVFVDHFRIGRQEDAHEFLRYVIDACHNTCIRVEKKGVGNGGGESGEFSVVKEIFGGALQSQVKCLLCGMESNKVDEIMDISLDVLNSSSLKEALHKFFQSEVLDGNNKYKCDKCRKLVSARKQMSILQAPNVLVIQLKRFDGIFGGKIDKAIAFEEVLFLSNYMCKGIQDPCPEYNLFATIVHSGFSPDSGHYYSYIKDAMSRWYCCNDSFVSLSTRQEVLSEKAYILFFSRSKQRPLTANTALGTTRIISNGCSDTDSSKISKKSPIKSLNPNQVVNESLNKDTVNSSKVHEVLSGPRMKFSSSDNSGSRPFLVSDSVKLIFHQKESCEKNGNVRSSNFLKKSENNSTLLKDMNGVAKSSNFANGGRRHSVFLANGKDKSESISADSSVGKCEVDGIKNNMPTGVRANNQVLQNGSGIRIADKLGPKQKCKEVGSSCTVNAEDAHSPKDSGELNSKRKMPEDLYNSYVENGQPHLKIEESSSNTKLQDDNSCRYLTEELSCNGKVQGRDDDCILLAKDAQSREKLEELKDILIKEASLVLRSCGWSNDVDNFMRSKRRCARAADEYPSNKSYVKRSLIADAKSTFLPQIPESLKGNLIKRLRTISQEKQSLGP